MRVIAVLLFFILGPTALGHSPASSQGQEQLAALVGAVLLFVFWLLYLWGSWLRRPKLRHALSFHGATLLCYLAVLGPLDEMAETSAAAHMVQHMLFIVVIAPLWVLARPLPQIVSGGGRVLALSWKPVLRFVHYPMLAAWLHCAAIWFWHMPDLYILALQNPWWHTIEHACFLITAGLFWWAVLRSSYREAPRALLALLLTLVQTGFLGAILTFARTPLYGEGRILEDQQLAGLIMWVVGAIPYLMACVWVGRRWYRKVL